MDRRRAHSSPRSRTRNSVFSRAGALATLLFLVATAVATSVAPSQAASSSLGLSMTVPSATSLITTGCATNSASTSFGVVQPSTNAVTGAACSINFGSSNDTSALRLIQQDGVGTGMFSMTKGAADTGFGTGGVRTFAIGAGVDTAFDVSVQRDGKVVVVGSNGNDGFIARRLANGTNDPAFNGGSPRIIDRGTANDIVMSVEVDREGRILYGGHTAPGASQNGFVGVLAPGGGDDPTFGAPKTIDLHATADSVEGIAVDSQGRLVAVGGTDNPGTRFAISRYKRDGTLDTTFNSTGVREVAYTGYSFGLDVAIRANDGLAVAGTASGTGLDFALLVLDSTGADDPTYVGSATGRQLISLAANDDLAQGVSVQADGKIVLAGESILAGAERVGVVRVNATGGIDTSFGGGPQRLNFGTGNEYAEGVLVQPDGAVILAGAANNYADTGLLRLTDAGVLDTTFDTDGMYTVNNGGSDSVGRPTLGPDGRVFVAGIANNDVLVQGFLGAQYADFAGTWSGAGSRFGACLETLSAGSPSWTVAGLNNCTVATPANWKAVAAQQVDATAIVATTGTGVSATAALRFGIQVDATQTKGRYVAPLEFELVAPAA